MTYRHAVAGLTLAGVVTLLACSGPAALDAPSSSGAAHSHGAIRISRVCGDTKAAIPLERPRQLEGRASLTARKSPSRNASKRSRRPSGSREPKALPWAGGRSPSRRFAGTSTTASGRTTDGRDRSSNRTSLIVDPPDGQLPFTPDAKKAEARSAARYGVGPFESYLDPDTGERCLTDGVTGMMWQGPNGGHNRIVQSPGFVTILHEEYRDRRIIPVDGRQHGTIRQWFGDAVGRWEGDTLVVDTTNFIDRTNYEWANIWTRPSESLHLVERFKRIDRGRRSSTRSRLRIRRRSPGRGRP